MLTINGSATRFPLMQHCFLCFYLCVQEEKKSVKKKRKRKKSSARRASDSSEEESDADSKVFSIFLFYRF